MAVTVTLVLLLTLGAVNNPLLETDPALADHVTAVLVVPCTAAVNCCVAPDPTLMLVGETATVIAGAAGVTVTEALACLVTSAAHVAVTVTLVLLLTDGAVNSPPLEIEPAVADQVTAEFQMPRTDAVNCCVLADITVALVGETVTLMVVPVDAEMIMCACSFVEAPRESEALTQKYFDTAAVGVPVTAPVLPLRARPAGNAPSTTL